MKNRFDFLGSTRKQRHEQILTAFPRGDLILTLHTFGVYLLIFRYFNVLYNKRC